MQGILIATGIAMFFAAIGTPMLINALTRLGIGSQERVDGVTAHLAKQGTPTMGGAMILVASTIGYVLSHVRLEDGAVAFRDPSAAGLLVLGTMWALGLLGAVDDIISVTRRRSLGLSPQAKTVAQIAMGVALAYAAMKIVGLAPRISFTGVRDLPVDLPEPVFAVWVFLVIFAISNGVNITSGLDGLGTGSSALALFVYVVIAFWEFRHPTVYGQLPTQGLLDVSVMGAALLGSCIGFLWWNAPPARIFDGDTGALAIGGALAAMAVFTRTQVLLGVIGGLFLAEHASSLIQRYVYKFTKRFWPLEHGVGRRVFKMAPLHHHFEMIGWQEVTVTVRFWLVAGVLAGFGLAIFYTDFLAAGGGLD